MNALLLHYLQNESSSSSSAPHRPRLIPLWKQRKMYLQKTCGDLMKKSHISWQDRERVGICLFSSQPLYHFRLGLPPGCLVIRGRNWKDETDGKYQEGKLSFPKGKLYYGETLFQGAVREFQEETGLDLLRYPNTWTLHTTHTKGYNTMFFLELKDASLFRSIIPKDQGEVEALLWMEKGYSCSKWNVFSKGFLDKLP